jgi:hypothetical protein
MTGEHSLEAPLGCSRLCGSGGGRGEAPILYGAGLVSPAELNDAPTLATIGTRGITQMSDVCIKRY